MAISKVGTVIMGGVGIALAIVVGLLSSFVQSLGQCSSLLFTILPRCLRPPHVACCALDESHIVELFGISTDIQV